jgi:hypothetical protein
VYPIAGAGNKLYVGLDRGEGEQIGISEDGGQTWRIQNTTRLGKSSLSGFATQEKVYMTSFGEGVSMSRDGGKTWVSKTKDDGLISNNTEPVVAVGNNVYAGTGMGLSVSRDGGNT